MELKGIRYFKNNKLCFGSISLGRGIEEITPIDAYDENSPILIPSYIDLHCHGGFGYDIMTCNSNMLCEFGEKLLSVGTGIYMPTLVGADFDMLEKLVEQLALAKEKHIGAEIAGVHIEGTFISKKKCGIINEKYIYPPDIRLVDRLLKYNLKLRFTVAPETDGALDFIEYAVKNGCMVSLGHSVADNKITNMALSRGADLITHIFNAMPALNHREPNLLSTALTMPVFCEVICDTYHISKEILKLIYMLKGRDKGIIVSDSISAMGLDEGKYSFCNKEIFVSGGKATDINGTLAGSICNIHTGVLNMLRSANVTFEEILPWAITNPAKALNIEDHIISVGKSPSMLLLDNTYNIKQIITF